MDDRNAIVQELAAPLASGRGWIKFLGILMIVAGVLDALTIVGILFAWLPIWLGVLLFQSASGMEQASINGDSRTFVMAQNKLRLFFVIQAIMIIVVFALAIMFVLFGGMAAMMGIMAHHASPTL